MDLLEWICLGGFAGVDLRTDSLVWIRGNGLEWICLNGFAWKDSPGRSRRSESNGSRFAGVDLLEWIYRNEFAGVDPQERIGRCGFARVVLPRRIRRR